MSMDDLINIFGSGFSFLNSNKMLGMPVIFWLILIALFGIIASFIKGSKDK